MRTAFDDTAMLNDRHKTDGGMLPQSRPLEADAADKPGQARNARPQMASVQPARGERRGTASPQPSRPQGQRDVSPNQTRAAARVFVLDRQSKPLMPCHPARARELLRTGRARIHRLHPFTIRLVDRTVTNSNVQPVLLKQDPGSKFTGIALVRVAADNAQHVLWLAELNHRGAAIRDALAQRRAFRRRRRSTNLRYRKPRFDNRTKPVGWLAPSLRHRVETTMGWTSRLRGLVPITGIAVERVRFDTQALQNPEIEGIEYQRGTLFGCEIQEYLLEKWGRQCAYCDAISVPLQKEHIHPRARGGSDRISNLTLSCERCNQLKGSRDIREFLAGDPERLKRILAHAEIPLRDAAAVNATRWALWHSLVATGLPVETATGGRTKWNRDRFGVAKTHALDAASVGAITALENWNMPVLGIACTGRGAYKRTRPTAAGFPCGYLLRQKSVAGFRTGDHVRAVVPSGSKKGTWTGRVAIRATGSFNIQHAKGVIQGISYRHCRILQRADGYGYHRHKQPKDGVSSPAKLQALAGVSTPII